MERRNPNPSISPRPQGQGDLMASLFKQCLSKNKEAGGMKIILENEMESGVKVSGC